MKLEKNELYAIADFLINNFDQCTLEEMNEYLSSEFKLSPEVAQILATQFIEKFALTPVVFDEDSINFLETFFSKVN